MFTQISTELELLLNNLNDSLDSIIAVKLNETNPNVYMELTGRSLGLTEAIAEVRKTKMHVDEHINEILKNTVDGNYVTKLGILEDENRVLRDKAYILQKDIDKLTDMLDTKTDPNNRLNKSVKELTNEEIEQILESSRYKELGYDEDEYDDSEFEE